MTPLEDTSPVLSCPAVVLRGEARCGILGFIAIQSQSSTTLIAVPEPPLLDNRRLAETVNTVNWYRVLRCCDISYIAFWWRIAEWRRFVTYSFCREEFSPQTGRPAHALTWSTARSRLAMLPCQEQLGHR